MSAADLSSEKKPREVQVAGIDRTMKLGIACVYFYEEQSAWMLDLQLEYLARTLPDYNYTIYAGANRLAPHMRRQLELTPRVRVVALPWYDGVGGREHAFYLDRLLESAVLDGCTHVAAIDADSFPIVPDWPRRLLSQMRDTVRIAAVLRLENLDTYLPHPCGYFMNRAFLTEHRPRLLASDEELASEPFRAFLRATGQRVDTGIGYGYALWRSREPWLQLLRSNHLSPHFLMAGIYGGVFFHLGASSRGPSFYADYMTRPSLRIAGRIRNLPLLWRLARSMEWRYVQNNLGIFESISRQLREDPHNFISALAGAPTDSLSSSELPCARLSPARPALT